MNNNKPIKDLDRDIALARADYVDKAAKKKMVQALKKLFVIAVVPSLGMITFLFLKPEVALILTIVSSVITVGAYCVADVKKALKLAKAPQNIISFDQNEDKDVEELLDDFIDELTEKKDKYYTQQYINSMSESGKDFSIEEKSVIEQSAEKVSDENEISLDAVQKRLSMEIDVYYSAYKLPTWNVTEEQWDILLSYFYKLVISKQIVERFYAIMSALVRYTLSNAIVIKKQSIGIVDFINNLDMIVDENITKKEFLKAKGELLNLVKEDNIIKFEQFPK